MLKPSEIFVDENNKLLHQNNIIENIVLELHQNEIMNLSDNILKGLLELSDKGHCLNDLRSILLVHDKRLLTIMSGY